MKRLVFTGIAIMVALDAGVFAADGDTVAPPKVIEFEGREWALHLADRATIEEYCGKMALCVSGEADTSVYLPNVAFQDGIIEVDIAAIGRAVPGVVFRGRGHDGWRNTIIFNRWPAKVRSGDAYIEQAVVTRRINTIVILNLRDAGQDGPSHSLACPEWLHVRIAVQGRDVRVFFDGNEQPSIELGAVFDQDGRGAVGLCGGGFYFANFRIATDQATASN